MKKLLGFFASIGLIVPIGTSVVSCHFGPVERVPSDLSMFNSADFEPTLIGWIKSGSSKDGKSLIDDTSKVITNYLESNKIGFNAYDLTTILKINNKIVKSDTNDLYEFTKDKIYDFEINSFFPGWVTAVKNSIDVKIKQFKLVELKYQKFIDKINTGKFDDYKKMITNLEKISKEELEKLVPKLFADTLSDSQFGIETPIRSKDYDLLILKDDKTPIGNKDVVDLKIKSVLLSIDLKDFGKKIWDNKHIEGLLSIKDGLFILTKNPSSIEK